MKTCREKTVLLALLMALGLTACSDSPASTTQPTSTTPATETSAPAAPERPERIVVGTKVDQFGTGYLDVSTYGYSGLDVDIARYLSMNLFKDDDPYILPVSSNTRESALTDGAVRFFAATYTILPDRQEKFSIAGPYLVTSQGVMLGENSPDISTISDLAGRRVCVVGRGSATAGVLKEFVPNSIPVEETSYSSCLTNLRDGNVDAFSTDLAILYGYAGNTENTGLRVVKGVKIGNPIYYGIAFRKQDVAFCMKAADAIKEMVISKQWDNIFNVNLPAYRTAFPEYQTQIQPTIRQIDDNSCK